MLNEDILHLICQQCREFHPKDCNKAWLALCLTSKACQHVAERYVYKEIVWKWDRLPAPPIVSLLNTLSQRPELGRLIERFTFRSRRSFQARGAPFLLADVSDLDAEPPGVPFRSEWIELLRAGHMDALLALLICQLPNLRYLCLVRPWEERPQMLSAVMKHFTFERLMRVDHHLDEYYETPATSDVDLSFYFQQSIERAEFSLARSRLAGHCPTLRSLTVEDTRESHLSLLPTNLEAFRWRLSMAIDWRNDLSLDLLIDSLPTVRRLSLGLELKRGRDLTMQIAGSVRKLAALKLDVLSIPVLFLSDFRRKDWSLECVPETVEELILTNDIGWQYEWRADGEAFWECLQQVRGTRLKSVDILCGDAGASFKYGRGFQATDDWKKWALEFRRRVWKLGQELGIKMQVTLLSSPCEGAFFGW